LDWRITSGFGFACLIAAFLVFLFYGDTSPAIVLLALGVVFVVSGGSRRVLGRAKAV
jgi:hypothetical protein